MSTSRWSTPARSSSNGSGCTSWWPAPTTPSSTTPRSSDDGIAAGRRRGRPASTPRPGTSSWLAATTLPYDYLIYAVGSTGAVPPSVPGAAEFAYPDRRTRAGAAAARRPRRAALRRRRSWSSAAGLTGIEAAAELAEQGRAGHAGVRRVLGAVPEHAGPPVGGQAAGKLGVTIVDGPGRSSPRSPPTRSTLADGRAAAQRGDDLDRGLRRARTWPPPAG